MAISIKTAEEIAEMRVACRLAGEVLDYIDPFVKPGITGLAQVRGYRGETKTNEQLVRRIQLDIYYLENWSVSLDAMIILQTAWQMIRPPKTAY